MKKLSYTQNRDLEMRMVWSEVNKNKLMLYFESDHFKSRIETCRDALGMQSTLSYEDDECSCSIINDVYIFTSNYITDNKLEAKIQEVILDTFSDIHWFIGKHNIFVIAQVVLYDDVFIFPGTEIPMHYIGQQARCDFKKYEQLPITAFEINCFVLAQKTLHKAGNDTSEIDKIIARLKKNVGGKAKLPYYKIDKKLWKMYVDSLSGKSSKYVAGEFLDDKYKNIIWDVPSEQLEIENHATKVRMIKMRMAEQYNQIMKVIGST